MAWAFILLVAAVLAESVMDPMFSLNPGVRGHVDSSSLRPEGKILPGGKFRLVDELRYAVVQLDADGRLDPEFQPLRTDMILDEWQPVDLALPSDGYALLTIGGSTQRISPDGRDVRAWGAFGSAPVCGGENSVPGQLFGIQFSTWGKWQLPASGSAFHRCSSPLEKCQPQFRPNLVGTGKRQRSLPGCSVQNRMANPGIHEVMGGGDGDFR